MPESTSKYDDIVQWLNNHKFSAEIAQILEEPFALHFLIVWSIFEVKCFDGFMKSGNIESFSDRLVQNGFQEDNLNTIVNYFHDRYQDGQLYKNLLNNKKSEQIKNDEYNQIRSKNFKALEDIEKFQFILFVIYRYRNNIFHGNKQVYNWQRYEKQIKKCTKAMQIFIDS